MFTDLAQENTSQNQNARDDKKDEESDDVWDIPAFLRQRN